MKVFLVIRRITRGFVGEGFSSIFLIHANDKNHAKCLAQEHLVKQGKIVLSALALRYFEAYEADAPFWSYYD